jgi:hypothetical protein
MNKFLTVLALARKALKPRRVCPQLLACERIPTRLARRMFREPALLHDRSDKEWGAEVALC